MHDNNKNVFVFNITPLPRLHVFISFYYFNLIKEIQNIVIILKVLLSIGLFAINGSQATSRFPISVVFVNKHELN